MKRRYITRFQPGWKVKMIDSPTLGVKVGDICTVESVNRSGNFSVFEQSEPQLHCMHPSFWELVQADNLLPLEIELLEWATTK